VLGALGNDDSPNNYELNVTNGSQPNPWLSYVADRFVANNAMPRSRLQDYRDGGFFETTVGGLKVLSINTIIYSVRHSPAKPAFEDPFGQFAWLRERLEAAVQNKERVWIVGHIPPGIETYGYTPLWQKQYVEAYLALVQDASLGQCIGAQLFGHVHAEEFRYLPDAPPRAGPIWLTGALSPVYKCNPSFRLVEYDEATGRLLNIKVFYAELKGAQPLRWNFGYDLLSAYPTIRAAAGAHGGLSNGVFRDFAARLRESWERGGEEFDTFALWYKTRFNSDLLCAAQSDAYNSTLSTDTKRKYVGAFLCAVRVGTVEDFKACAAAYGADVGMDEAVAAVWPTATDTGAATLSVQGRQRHWERIAHMSELSSLPMACSHVQKALSGL